MDSEPRWLDIQDELYPDLFLVKHIVFESSHSGELKEFYTEIKYNSFRREIDLTPVILKYFFDKADKRNAPPENEAYQVLIRDKEQGKLNFVGYFPHDDVYVLGEQFLSEDILYFIIREEQKTQVSCQVPDFKEVQKQVVFACMQKFQVCLQEKSQPSGPQETLRKSEQTDEGFKTKQNKRKSIEQVLKTIAEWRKLISIKKLPSAEAAQKVGMSKRSLEDYFTIVKLAEKYGFDFEGKMKNGFAQLRSFVKDKHETKPAPKVQILQKFKPTKK